MDRSDWKLWLKLGVSGALLALLSAQIDAAALLDLAARTDATLAAGALALVLCSYAVVFRRWWVLLVARGERIRWRPLVPSFYVGLLFNHVLPAAVGGDILRTLYLMRRGYEPGRVIGSAIADRVAGLVGVVVLVVAALPWVYGRLPELGSTAAVVVALFGAGLLAGYRHYPQLEQAVMRRLQQRLPDALQPSFSALRDCLRHYHAAPGLLAGAVVLSVVSHVCLILAYLACGAALGVAFALSDYFIAVPLVMLVQMLPVSLGGLGLREAAFVGVATALGADAQQAIAVALAYLAVCWISVLPGLAAWLYIGFQPKETKHGR